VVQIPNFPDGADWAVVYHGRVIKINNFLGILAQKLA
jgi:hypothetical protein